MKTLKLVCILALSIGTTGCLPNNSGTATSKNLSQTAPSVTPTLPTGPKAAKIIFKQVSADGSFAAAPSGGTPNSAGNGVQASQVFNPDGSVLASSTSASTWPAWLNSVELGISGSLNSASIHGDCARFATSTDENAKCKFDLSTETSCGAPSGYYRISEYDCHDPMLTPKAAEGIGNGSNTDGIYIRTIFNRDTSALGAYENILAVLEYSASVMNPAPSNPTSCFNGGKVDVESCSDMTWRIFTKHSVSENLQSFLLLVPPAFASINTTTGTGGSGISTKQFIIPLASDSDLKVLQISRTGLSSNLMDNLNFKNICAPNTTPANSALCVGMVFYSLTFYRI